MTSTPGYKEYKDDATKASLYNHRLATAEKAFDSWAAQARDWWDRYENVPKVGQATAKGHTVNVTTGVSVIDALFSGLTAVDTQFILTAMTTSEPAQALLAEVALNQEWDLNDVAEERNAAIKDSLITGIGFVKVAYDFWEIDSIEDRSEEDIGKDVDELIAEARSLGHDIDAAQIGKLVPTTAEAKEVVRDRIVTDFVPWDEIRWDPKARRWCDVKWTAQLTKLPLEEIQENPLWKEYLKRNRSGGGLKKLQTLRPDATMDRSLLVTGAPEPDDSLVTICEYWDMESGTFCVIPKGQNLILFEGVNPFALEHDYDDRNPFVPLVLRGTNRRVRGISDMEVMIRSLNEKNLYRSRTANYIDRFVPKVLAEEDAFTDEGKAALQNSEYGSIVSVGRGTDPHNVVPLSPPVLPIEAFNMNDRIDNEIREATGVNELMRGLFPDRKRTATETNQVVSASAARQSEKRNTLEHFHIEIAKRILSLMQKFYDQPRMARLADASFGEVGWEFTGEDLIGRFNIAVHLAPKEPVTRDTMKQEATVALNVLGPFATPDPTTGKSVIDQATLIQWFMRKYGFERRDINELLNSADEQQIQHAGAMQAQAGGPPPGNLTPDELLAASNAPATLGAAVGGAVPPEQGAIAPPVNRQPPPGL